MHKDVFCESSNSQFFKFVAHSAKVLLIAKRFGWLPGARYSNLRDVKRFDRVGFLDICWHNYDFRRHMEAARSTNPFMTVARDIDCINDLSRIIDQAYALSEHSQYVVLVPKDRRLGPELNELIPPDFLLGYSVPTKYGSTTVPTDWFNRPTHLLGGRPDVQRRLAERMPIVSLDCNRFTFDARFGDYFDGEIFRPHPIGGYEQCIRDSIRNINKLWKTYIPSKCQPHSKLREEVSA